MSPLLIWSWFNWPRHPLNLMNCRWVRWSFNLLSPPLDRWNLLYWNSAFHRHVCLFSILFLNIRTFISIMNPSNPTQLTAMIHFSSLSIFLSFHEKNPLRAHCRLFKNNCRLHLIHYRTNVNQLWEPWTLNLWKGEKPSRTFFKSQSLEKQCK